MHTDESSEKAVPNSTCSDESGFATTSRVRGGGGDDSTKKEHPRVGSARGVVASSDGGSWRLPGAESVRGVVGEETEQDYDDEGYDSHDSTTEDAMMDGGAHTLYTEKTVSATVVEEGELVEAQPFRLHRNKKFRITMVAVVVLFLATLLPLVLILPGSDRDGDDAVDSKCVPDPALCGCGRQDDYRGDLSQTETGLPCQYWDSINHIFEEVAEQGLLQNNYCRNPSKSQDRAWCYTSPTTWEYCLVPTCDAFDTSTSGSVDEDDSCGSSELRQRDYRGKIAVTQSGINCQRWDLQAPHKPEYTNETNPEDGLEENYCRNPTGTAERRAWCYTVDPNVEKEPCNVPFCSPEKLQKECGSIDISQSDYRGTINVTADGVPCQKWDEQSPHVHDRTDARYPYTGVEGGHNYCRNPDGEKLAWCYTTDPNVRWAFCDVPPCGVDAVSKETCGSLSLNQADYRGNISVTEDGYTCLPWNDVKPSPRTVTPESHPYSGLLQNYCRNPDGGARPWCYTANTVFGYCDVPACENITDFGPQLNSTG